MSASVMVVEDDAGLREALVDTLQMAGYRTVEAGDGQEALSKLEGGPLDLVLTDFQMPGLDGQGLLERIRAHDPTMPVIMMTAHGTVDGAVRAMRTGATDYLTKPFKPTALLERVKRHCRITRSGADEPVANDPRSREIFTLAARVAASDVTVMITGESGTGKEVIARYLHANSSRAGGPFVAINCAAIPEQMLEATLFGYEKGAFTGALKSMPGKFELAHGGTLLLDEITEMNLGLQAKLLRVLQERELERLGGRSTIELDVRVLATTNRDPAAEVREGRFREDLYYRLNVFALHVPPLRDRPGDILALADRSLARAAGATGRPAPGLAPEARKRLLAHAWPGNVRELDNMMQRAAVLCVGTVVEEQHLRFGRADAPVAIVDASADSARATGSTGLRAVELEAITQTLRDVVGNRRAAAERLGISERTLRYKLARMRADGIAVPGDQV